MRCRAGLQANKVKRDVALLGLPAGAQQQVQAAGSQKVRALKSSAITRGGGSACKARVRAF